MPVFDIQNQLVTFIHIPKTGGTSVEAWLASQGKMYGYSTIIPSFLKCTPQHFTADNLELLGPFINEKSFCIVRDPYSRAESEYNFRQKNVQENLRTNFSVWMLKQLDHYKKNKHHLDNHFLPQAYFVNSKVKHFKFEDGFGSIFTNIAKHLDLVPPESTNHLNKSVKSSYVWTNELLDSFNAIYSCDFETFEYRKKQLN